MDEETRKLATLFDDVKGDRDVEFAHNRAREALDVLWDLLVEKTDGLVELDWARDDVCKALEQLCHAAGFDTQGD